MDINEKLKDINEDDELYELKLQHEKIVKEIQRRESLLKLKQQSNGYEKIDNEEEKEEKDDKDDIKLNSSYKKEEDSFWKRGLNLIVTCLGIELYILDTNIDSNIDPNN